MGVPSAVAAAANPSAAPAHPIDGSDAGVNGVNGDWSAGAARWWASLTPNGRLVLASAALVISGALVGGIGVAAASSGSSSGARTIAVVSSFNSFYATGNTCPLVLRGLYTPGVAVLDDYGRTMGAQMAPVEGVTDGRCSITYTIPVRGDTSSYNVTMNSGESFTYTREQLAAQDWTVKLFTM